MLVKYYAKEVLGRLLLKFSTYSMEMLVVFFLQRVSPPILPPIAMLQQLADPEARILESGWECSYCDNVCLVQQYCPSELNIMTLKQLLTEFFHFYGSYDYKQVICPLLGRSVDLDVFENVKSLPPEMKLYEENKQIDSKNIFQRDSPIRMQDPFQLCWNITKNITPLTHQAFINSCKLAHEICVNTADELLLEKLFSVDGESVMPHLKSSWKIHIEYNTSLTKASTDSELLEWHKLTTEAALLVMTEIFKVDVKMKNVEICHKVPKTKVQQDVHTLQHNKDSVYVCTGLSAIWSSRKKASKLLNKHCEVFLTPFEREIRVSNLLYKGSGTKSFNLLISSYDNFKQNCKGIDLTINVHENRNWTKEMGAFVTRYLNQFVKQAYNYLKINEGETKQLYGGANKQLLKDVVDAVWVENALDFDTWAEIEDPDIIAQKKRIHELEKQSLLLESILKNSENRCETYNSQNITETAGSFSGMNPILSSIETNVNSKGSGALFSKEKCETVCTPVVL